MLVACLAIPLAAIYYAALCLLRPFAECRKCEATGHREIRGKTKVCRRCRGRRYRLRYGRRLHNHWRRTRELGTR
ncbi:hypothetical protein [Streptomyces meridianus]|uniref:Uncharacterized protein n=1 Tax=Streptomyces meridianus TaxID=2938945 RepID=A0ABT0XD59_9ACTN|nr:hypothetical protein [Streptomyces meridianus]MCM2580461.1 hypothetical protein [Streptomyces meridianus]